jgi:hypothetical protein
VLARRTGGQRGLFLRFHTALGRVMVRELAADIAAAMTNGGIRSKQNVG